MVSLLAEAFSGFFSYNRQNFLFDRELRQKMEYQMVDMRLAQAKLWRSDVRDIFGLTLAKAEAYLLVIVLELGFCVMAFAKGRVPHGTPSWLASCHTLSMVGAFMYLFMALWLGMHAFVAAQAYKVRNLTHYARLPIPNWRSVEASRTYGSAFEKMRPTQLLRLPWAMGYQERRVRGGAGTAARTSSAGGSAEEAQAILAVGPEHAIQGVTVLAGSFQSHSIDETAAKKEAVIR